MYIISCCTMHRYCTLTIVAIVSMPITVSDHGNQQNGLSQTGRMAAQDATGAGIDVS